MLSNLKLTVLGTHGTINRKQPKKQVRLSTDHVGQIQQRHLLGKSELTMNLMQSKTEQFMTTSATVNNKYLI